MGSPEAGLREEMDMNRWMIVALGGVIIIAAPFWVLAEPPDKTGSKDVQPVVMFVGFSDDSAAADIGFPGMNLACQNKFGDMARIGTTAEYVSSPAAVGAPIAAGAWIQPVIVTMVSPDGTSFPKRGVLDISGALLNADEGNCQVFSSTQFADDNIGLIVTDTGSIIREFCNIDRRVACSAP